MWLWDESSVTFYVCRSYEGRTGSFNKHCDGAILYKIKKVEIKIEVRFVAKGLPL